MTYRMRGHVILKAFTRLICGVTSNTSFWQGNLNKIVNKPNPSIHYK